MAVCYGACWLVVLFVTVAAKRVSRVIHCDYDWLYSRQRGCFGHGERALHSGGVGRDGGCL